MDKGHQLLEDLLKWSTSFEQTSNVELKKQDISEVVTRVSKFSSVKRKDINIVNQLTDDLEINMNPAMMETVLRNLIAN